MKMNERKEFFEDIVMEVTDEILESGTHGESESRLLKKDEKIKDKLAELFTYVKIAINEMRDETSQESEKEIYEKYRKNIEKMYVDEVLCNSVIAVDILEKAEKITKKVFDK